jgi:hypothetical protein
VYHLKILQLKEYKYTKAMGHYCTWSLYILAFFQNWGKTLALSLTKLPKHKYEKRFSIFTIEYVLLPMLRGKKITQIHKYVVENHEAMEAHPEVAVEVYQEQ